MPLTSFRIVGEVLGGIRVPRHGKKLAGCLTVTKILKKSNAAHFSRAYAQSTKFVKHFQ